MTKEEARLSVMGAISMALKDSILQQGFEIICKNLSELEKENAELKTRDCWKFCEYANPKSELIGQHIKDVQNLTKAKEIIKNLVEFDSSYKDDEEYQRKSELYDKLWEEAEQFLGEN